MRFIAILSCVSCAFAAISGDLTVSFADEKVKIKGDLTGLPASVTKGGIHVHTGTDCSNASAVGGHLMSGYIDGWLKTKYSTGADGSATVNLELTGYMLADVLGKCVVMHGVSSAAEKLSAHAARGQIVKINETAYSAAITKHTESELTTTPQGTLTITMHAGNMKITGKLTGLAPNLKDAGIHIHSKNSTCASGDVGGHLFGDGDTWLDTKYDSNAEGKSTIDIETAAGSHALKQAQHTTLAPAVENHCLVIHGADGSKIGIGKIACAATCTARMGDFPTSTPDNNKETDPGSSGAAWGTKSFRSVSGSLIIGMALYSFSFL